jgi:NAD-reducing hydrogenase small subunit
MNRLRIATASLAGCFGCHMSLLDIDETLLDLLPYIELDRSPLTDLKEISPCDVGFIEGGLCNAENVEVLRAFRRQCRTLVAVGACAINGGLPAQRNHLALADVLEETYHASSGLAAGGIPNDPELPLPLDRVHPLHEVVAIDHFIPGCPPSPKVLRAFLLALLEGREFVIPPRDLRYD